MSYKIRLEKGAKLDIDDALFYYENEVSKKVAQKFLDDIENRLKSLKINPFYRIYYKDFRGIPLKKYPYIVFFKIDEDNKLILVNSVFQTDQNPNKRF